MPPHGRRHSMRYTRARGRISDRRNRSDLHLRVLPLGGDLVPCLVLCTLTFVDACPAPHVLQITGVIAIYSKQKTTACSFDISHPPDGAFYSLMLSTQPAFHHLHHQSSRCL
ncbi:hypothetical protein CC86DRAFT_29436 [Ophiobolus disseminans]|uniref:Uncharacterized protein n=1 Tax=Ophiobolus disseminans TaxID=1469910 RepID=A0A6A7A0K2_9PLEO|nr:hypothetical protein CC86DRAFT_29436 [Ophiobolus disseminans]